MNGFASSVAVIASCLMLTACSSTKVPDLGADAPYKPAGGPQRIFPAGDIMLASVYRTLVPLKDNGLPELREICPNDFTDTPALAQIRTSYLTPKGVRGLDEKTSLTDGALLAGGIKFNIISGSASYNPTVKADASFTGVEVQSLTAQDADIVREKLGKACKDLIADWRRKGHGVYVVFSAYKATDVRLEFTIKDEIKGEIGISAAGMTPEIDASKTSSGTETLSGKDLYYKVATIF